MGHTEEENYCFPIFGNVRLVSCFSVDCNAFSNRYCCGFREFILLQTRISLKNFYCCGNIYDLCFHAIHTHTFGSAKKTILQFGKNRSSIEACKAVVTQDINVIGNVIFFFPDSLVLLSFRLHMPERHFLVLTSPSTRLLLKSASSIKQPIYLYPICQWRPPCLRKMDGLRTTFRRPLSCPRII